MTDERLNLSKDSRIIKIGFSKSSTKRGKLELHQQLNESELDKIYTEFNAQKDKRMSATVLCETLLRIARLDYEADDFEIMFMKMNNTRSGYVSWDEFISYLILGFHQSEITSDFETLEAPIPVSSPRMCRSGHRFPINRIAYCPTVRGDRSISWQEGSLMTCSRDGTINYWSLDLQFERSVKSTSPILKIQQTWVTDMVVMPDLSIVCTSSTERELRFYDTSARKFELRVIFQSMTFAIRTMHYHYSTSAGEDSKLVLGDRGGNIHLINIETMARGPFRSKLGLPLQEPRYETVLKGLVAGFKAHVFKDQHTTFIRQVQFYPALNSIISCAECDRTGLLIKDAQDVKEGYVFRTPKGTNCFAVTDKAHILVGGSSDCIVRVWNPFVTKHPTASFYGHHATIDAFVLQDEGKRLYSLSQDKCIKVWDVVNQECIQTYSGIPPELGEYSDMTALYNPHSREWLIGSSMIAVLPLNPKQSGEHTDGFTHMAGVSVVLYNSLFKVVVTCGLDSHIIIWNPWDGRRMMAIRDAHSKSVHAELMPIEITSAAFDPGLQRLITGGYDGTLKIWNFNTGTCLRNLKLDTECEIKEIVWIKNRILAMGWNRRVTEFADEPDVLSGNDFHKSWDLRHKEDISSAAATVPQTIVTATYDGEFIMWRLETGQPYKQYNVMNPSRRIKIQFKAAKHKDTSSEKGEKFSVTAARKSIVSGKFSLGGVSLASQRMSGGPTSTLPKARANAFRMRRVSTVAMPESLSSMRMLAIHSMIFLNTRPMLPNVGTLLIALENGNIQVWSHHINGAFITSFSAIHKAGDYVVSMATDTKNEYLFTG